MTNLILDWSPNPVSELVSQYRVYRTLDGVGPDVIGVSDTNHFEVPNPAAGQHTYFVQAVNFVGESALSAGAVGPDIPTIPAQPTLTIVIS
jgi:hypothetical protein